MTIIISTVVHLHDLERANRIFCASTEAFYHIALGRRKREETGRDGEDGRTGSWRDKDFSLLLN